MPLPCVQHRGTLKCGWFSLVTLVEFMTTPFDGPPGRWIECLPKEVFQFVSGTLVSICNALPFPLVASGDKLGMLRALAFLGP